MEEMSALYLSYPLPLDSHCIRVLEILPSVSPLPDPTVLYMAPTPSQPPFCIRTVDLSTHPSFVALSYVWNPSSVSAPPSSHPPATHASTTIPVTQPCYSALLHLRATLGGFTIWIDAQPKR